MNKIPSLIAVLLAIPLIANAAVISNIAQLDQEAEFHFSLMSDNKGDGTGSSDMGKCNSWVKSSGSLFVIGLGDNLQDGGDQFDNLLRDDSYWNNHFYPNVADGENQHFSGSQSNWGSGRKIFNYCNNFWGRHWIEKNPYISADGDGNVPDYYALFDSSSYPGITSGFKIHLIQLTYSDSGPGLVEDSRNFMQDKLEEIQANRTNKDIVIVLAHGIAPGNFPVTGNFNSYRRELLLTTADFCGSATVHQWQKHNPPQTYGPNDSVIFNSGACGAAGADGYIDFHVFDNPPRLTIQYMLTRRDQRQLMTGPEYNSGAWVKEIGGPSYEADWNNFPLGPLPNNAELISDNIPDTLMPNETAAVTVVMKNTGSETWSESSSYRLGSVGDDSDWTGSSRITLPHDVAPDQTVTFNFNITAPGNIAPKNCEWRMVQDGVEWFGDKAGNSIDVTYPIFNFLQNPSFEEGGATADNWNVSGSYIRTTEESYDGGHSLKGTGSGSLGNAWQSISVTPNTNYNISARIKFPTLGSAGQVVLDLMDKPTPETEVQFVVNPSDNWQHFTGSFNSGSESSINLRVFTTSTFNGSYYVDDLKFEDPTVYVLPNDPPQFTNSPALYAEVGGGYSYTAQTTDADGDPVTLSSVALPSWLTFNAVSGLLSGSPGAGDIGLNSVVLQASDGNAHTDLNFEITVSGAGNDAPVLTSTPVTGVIENSTYNYTIAANDPDGDTIFFGGATVPAWLSFNSGTGVLSGTPTSANVGVHAVTLSVSDGTEIVDQDFNVVVFETPAASNLIVNGSFENGGSSPASWDLTGAATGSNDTAQGSGSSSLKLVNDGNYARQTFSVIPNTDYDVSVWINASAMTTGIAVFDLSDRPSAETEVQFVLYNANSGWEEFSGSFNSGSETSITLRIFSPGMIGAVYFDNVVISAQGGGNVTPVITSTPVTIVNEGDNYSYLFTAADPDPADTLVYSAVSVPGWLSFDIATGILSGTSSSADVGVHSITLRVSDGTDNVDQSFDVTVVGNNVAPVWVSNPLTKADATVGLLYSGSLSGDINDADGDTLSFVKTSGTASWLSISTDGSYSGTPGAEHLGFNTAVIEASDGINPAVLTVLSFTVIAGADPYENWKIVHGVTDDNADDDGDGIINLMEFALGGDPSSDVSGETPEISQAVGDVQFSFHRAEATVTYIIEKSSDLSSWTDHITIVDDSYGAVGADCVVPVSLSEMTNGKLFLRLKVQNN